MTTTHRIWLTLVSALIWCKINTSRVVFSTDMWINPDSSSLILLISYEIWNCVSDLGTIKAYKSNFLMIEMRHIHAKPIRHWILCLTSINKYIVVTNYKSHQNSTISPPLKKNPEIYWLFMISKSLKKVNSDLIFSHYLSVQ